MVRFSISTDMLGKVRWDHITPFAQHLGFVEGQLNTLPTFSVLTYSTSKYPNA